MANNKKDNEDLPDENSGNADDSADNFGLPDIEYKPLDREKTTQQVHEKTSSQEAETPAENEEEKPPRNSGYSVDDDDEPSSKAPLFIGLIIIVVILVGGFLLYQYWYVPKAEKEKQELARIEKEKKDAEAAAKLKAEAEQRRLDSLAAVNAKPTTGTIETLTARTKRWFVIVTSDIDDDLVMDFAKKLSVKGISSRIIPPYGIYKFYRLGIADFETFSEAQASADTFKGEYGSAVWVMKY